MPKIIGNTVGLFAPPIKNEDVQRWNLTSNIVLKDFPKTWEDVQTIVRSGLAPQYFSVGDQFNVLSLAGVTASVGNSVGATGVTVDKSKFVDGCGEIPAGEKLFTYDGKSWRDEDGSIVDISNFGIVVAGKPVSGDCVSFVPTITMCTFVVIGFDQETPANKEYVHSMTLQTLHSVRSIAFDTPEAMWFIDGETYNEGLMPGDYSFSLETSNYRFTTTKHIPVGGQIVFNYSDLTIRTYESALSTNPIELVNIELGEGGTAMPSVSTNTVGENVNSLNRTRYGSDNWAESDVRTWLNSSAGAGSWWEPKSVFDRPNAKQSSVNGFLYCTDPSFIAIIGNVEKTTQQGFTDGYGLAHSNEKFFLPSVAEVFGGVGRKEDGADGEPYTYYGEEYSDLTAPDSVADENRIKISGAWWLRSASTDTPGGYAVRYVHADGRVYRGSAYNGLNIFPTCAIV